MNFRTRIANRKSRRRFYVAPDFLRSYFSKRGHDTVATNCGSIAFGRAGRGTFRLWDSLGGRIPPWNSSVSVKGLGEKGAYLIVRN